MSAHSSRRALHFVFKVGGRTATADFYRNVLGMHFLRHEEFEEGCQASCNGPYDGKWSKGMVGYGPEDDHFVVELTYNYGIGAYKRGNDFRGLTIKSVSACNRVIEHNYPHEQKEGHCVVLSPDGHPFHLINEDVAGDPVKVVSLSVSNLERSLQYWSGLLGMQVFERGDQFALLGYSDQQCKLEIVDIGQAVNHAAAFGRIAFSCPREELPEIQRLMQEKNETILKPLVVLDTPGKATVEVVILADPDGHEICFVGDEAFRCLSQVDPRADELLQQAIAADGSDEWFAKKGKAKEEA